MLELLPPLNEHNPPWMDTIHPTVVHFVIAMALIQCDLRPDRSAGSTSESV